MTEFKKEDIVVIISCHDCADDTSRNAGSYTCVNRTGIVTVRDYERYDVRFFDDDGGIDGGSYGCKQLRLATPEEARVFKLIYTIKVGQGEDE